MLNTADHQGMHPWDLTVPSGSLASIPHPLEISHMITRIAGKCRLAQCLGQRGECFVEQSLPHPTFCDIKYLFPTSRTHTVDILYPRDIINSGWSGNWNLSRIYKRRNYWIQGNIYVSFFKKRTGEQMSEIISADFSKIRKLLIWSNLFHNCSWS